MSLAPICILYCKQCNTMCINIIYAGFPGLGFQVKNICVMFVFVVDTERGVNQYQVQFKNLFQLILKPFNYIQ